MGGYNHRIPLEKGAGVEGDDVMGMKREIRQRDTGQRAKECGRPLESGRGRN